MTYPGDESDRVINRRNAIAALAATLGAASSARAQQPTQRRIGLLIPYPETDAETQAHLTALKEELRRLGWTEGRNLHLEPRWAPGSDPALLERHGKELVALKPDALLVRSTVVTTRILQLTRSIPLVFVAVSDPVGDGFVTSLAQPGGNATGFTNVESSLGGKWLQILKETDPRLKRVAVLYGAKTAAGGGAYYLRLIKDAAASLQIEAEPTGIDDTDGITKALAAFARKGAGGLLVLPDATTSAQRETILTTAARHRLPAIYPFEQFTRNGGLISYGVEITDQFRRAAGYLDRILRGEKPGSLPVQAPTKFELVVNLKTAKALGLKMPQTVLLQATRVIE